MSEHIALTPEQVAERIGGGATASWVRRQARIGAEHLRLGRGRIAFTEDQLTALIARNTRTEQTPSGDRLVTARSAARSR